MKNVKNLKGEVWKDIKGFEGYYQVSSLGRVRSLDRVLESKRYKNKIQKGIILSLRPGAKGYVSCYLTRLNKRKILLVHRIMAIAFIPNLENKPQVNHKDLNKSNNIISNLEWVTARENTLHAVKNNAITYHESENSPNSVFTNNQVNDIRLKLNHLNNSEVAKYYGVHKSTIARIRNFTTYKSV